MKVSLGWRSYLAKTIQSLRSAIVTCVSQLLWVQGLCAAAPARAIERSWHPPCVQSTNTRAITPALQTLPVRFNPTCSRSAWEEVTQGIHRACSCLSCSFGNSCACRGWAENCMNWAGYRAGERSLRNSIFVRWASPRLSCWHNVHKELQDTNAGRIPESVQR